MQKIWTQHAKICQKKLWKKYVLKYAKCAELQIYAQYAPVDHPAIRQETTEPSAYCVAKWRRATVLSLVLPCAQNMPPAILVQPHCPRRVALIALSQPLALVRVIYGHESNRNPMVSQHIFINIQKVFCEIVKNYIVQLIYIYMRNVSVNIYEECDCIYLHTLHKNHHECILHVCCIYCIFASIGTVDWIVSPMLSGNDLSP